jgi:hypothetical protein
MTKCKWWQGSKFCMCSVIVKATTRHLMMNRVPKGKVIGLTDDKYRELAINEGPFVG